MPSQRDPDAPPRPEDGLLPPPPDTSPPHDGLLLPLIHELTQPYIDAGLAHGPMPRLRTDEWLDAHPDQQLAHVLICGIAAIVHHPHQTVAALLKTVASDVSEAIADQPDYISQWTRTQNELRRANDRADRLTELLGDAYARLAEQQKPAA